MITERGKKRGTHFTQDIMFSLCKYRSYIYTEVNYDIMFPLYGIVFTHYINIFCSITTWWLICHKLILDHITICMQKGVACFIDPTENHLWAAVYHLSMPCHSLFTACFWCPRVAKKNTVTAGFPLNMHLKKTTAVELVNRESSNLQSAEEKRQ